VLPSEPALCFAAWFSALLPRCIGGSGGSGRVGMPSTALPAVRRDPSATAHPPAAASLQWPASAWTTAALRGSSVAAATLSPAASDASLLAAVPSPIPLCRCSSSSSSTGDGASPLPSPAPSPSPNPSPLPHSPSCVLGFAAQQQQHTTRHRTGHHQQQQQQQQQDQMEPAAGQHHAQQQHSRGGQEAAIAAAAHAAAAAVAASSNGALGMQSRMAGAGAGAAATGAAGHATAPRPMSLLLPTPALPAHSHSSAGKHHISPFRRLLKTASAAVRAACAGTPSTTALPLQCSKALLPVAAACRAWWSMRCAASHAMSPALQSVSAWRRRWRTPPPPSQSLLPDVPRSPTPSLSCRICLLLVSYSLCYFFACLALLCALLWHTPLAHYGQMHVSQLQLPPPPRGDVLRGRSNAALLLPPRPHRTHDDTGGGSGNIAADQELVWSGGRLIPRRNAGHVLWAMSLPVATQAVAAGEKSSPPLRSSAGAQSDSIWPADMPAAHSPAARPSSSIPLRTLSMSSPLPSHSVRANAGMPSASVLTASDLAAAPAAAAAVDFSSRDLLGDSFTVVSYASELYYPRVLNLLGSLHVWEPQQRIVVYDLGMSQSQLSAMQCMHNVDVRPFNFSAYPAHVRNLFQYAFKPLLVYDALQHASAVMILDSGIEVRAPLRSIKQHLRQHGHFFASQPNKVWLKTHDDTFRALGVDVNAAEFPQQWRDVPFCAAAIFGFVRTHPSAAYERVVVRAAECALQGAGCLSPPGSGRSNHNFDQSVYSILMRVEGLQCRREMRFREMDMSRCPLRADYFKPEEDGGVVLCMRRWHRPLPYPQHVRTNPRCTAVMEATTQGQELEQQQMRKHERQGDKEEKEKEEEDGMTDDVQTLDETPRAKLPADAAAIGRQQVPMLRRAPPRQLQASRGGGGGVGGDSILRVPADDSFRDVSAPAAGVVPSASAALLPVSSWLYVAQRWNGDTVEHLPGAHLQANSALLRCLYGSHQRDSCADEIRRHRQHMENTVTWQNTRERLDALRTVLFAGLRMPWSYTLFALTAVLFLLPLATISRCGGALTGKQAAAAAAAGAATAAAATAAGSATGSSTNATAAQGLRKNDVALAATTDGAGWTGPTGTVTTRRRSSSSSSRGGGSGPTHHASNNSSSSISGSSSSSISSSGSNNSSNLINSYSHHVVGVASGGSSSSLLSVPSGVVFVLCSRACRVGMVSLCACLWSTVWIVVRVAIALADALAE